MIDPDTTSDDERQGLVHEALLYRDPDELRRVVATFLTAAADAGEPVLAVLPGLSLDILDDTLDGAPGALRRLDMREVGRNPACILPLVQAWISDQSGPARVVSEAFWPQRGYAASVECLRHEALLNHVLADAPATILCPFDAVGLSAEVLSGAEMTHPRLVDAGGERRPSARYGDPLVLHAGSTWPQLDPVAPVSEHSFAGDLGALRRAVAADPLLDGLSAERRHDMVFAVNEAATNDVRHGDGACRIRIWRDEGAVVAEVRTSTPVADVMAGRRRPGPDAAEPRGLWLVNQCCALIELRSGDDGSSLRIHVDLDRAVG